MKKLVMILALATGTYFAANAQAPEGFQFGAGIRAALPIGDFSDSHSFGIGAEVQGEYGFSSMVSGVITSGYTSFFGKSTDVGGISIKYDAIGYIPFLAGVRVYPSSQFFIGGQVGYGLFTGNGNSTGAFNYQPQIGYNGSNFQVALNFNAMTKDGSTSSHLGLTGIYKFGGSGSAKK